MKRSLALILVLMCLMLSGCRYSHEITDMAFAVALGFDKAEEGLLISMQFARPLSISGNGEAGGGESSESDDKDAAKNKNTTLLSVKAEDFYTALSIAENSLSKQINLSHVKLVLFSSELAQDGIGDYVTMLMKNSQLAPKPLLSPAKVPEIPSFKIHSLEVFLRGGWGGRGGEFFVCGVSQQPGIGPMPFSCIGSAES